MIFIYHHNNTVTKVWDELSQSEIAVVSRIVSLCLLEMAEQFPESLLVWCNDAYKEQLNIAVIPSLFHHKKALLSYNPCLRNYLPEQIGYVSESLFIKINKKVCYPTWQMSSVVGSMHASVLIALKGELIFDKNTDYFLHSVAKLAMPSGLFCYSQPSLLLPTAVTDLPQSADNYTLFRFVRQHFKLQWVFLLLLNFFCYERRLPFLPFLLSLFYRRRFINENTLNEIKLIVPAQENGVTIDVLIPTIGRKEHLHAFLKNLAEQSLLPDRVIIVEQNPLENSVSELDFISSETWPFAIEHLFIHQAGACNARNLALSKVVSDWVFMADDDIVIEKDFLEKAFLNIRKWKNNAYTFRCYQENEVSSFKKVIQWEAFGSGCSIVKRTALEDCCFHMGFEFGFGEDVDFGMQLRNKGNDIVYLPEPDILHLKAPMGGFRSKPVLAWQNQIITPKPSPTVMLYLLLNNSREQLLGYKTTLCVKYFRHQRIRNPIRYFKMFQKQWQQSLFWAKRLQNKSTI